MTTEIYPATDFIGGGAGALDAIPVATLDAMDAAQIMSASVHVPYTLNATSGVAEDSPWIIAPNDVGGGDQRWEMISVHALGFEATVPSGDPKIVFDIGGTDKWYIGVDDDDADKLKIGVGAAVGTTTKISLDGTNVDFNSQALTSVGAIGCGAISSTDSTLWNKASAIYGTMERSDVVGLQFFLYDHDNIGLFFDAGYSPPNMGLNWRSGDAGSNFGIYKINNKLELVFDSGVAVNDGVFWNTGVTLDTSGNFDITVHDAGTVGLTLGGTLVTASAVELNLNDGASYGANDSGGVGFRAIKVPNL